MTGSPAGRVLTLLERVQERPGLTAQELADELDVGERSVRRYVRTLQDLGIPVHAVRGRTGGYRLDAGYRMPPLMLGTDEAVALTLTLAVLTGPTADDGPTDTALAKLRRSLPRSVSERVDDVLAAVAPPSRRDTLAPRATGRPAVLATLAACVVGRRTVRIRHRSGRLREREVNPYGLAVVRGQLYLHGWCHLRRARRTFRVDRIENAEQQPATFRMPDLDVADVVARSLATSWQGWSVSVLLDAPLDDVRSWIPPYVGIAEAVGDATTRLRLTTDNLETTVLRLSDHPFAMTVEEPAELRETFARRGAWMSAVGASAPPAGARPARGSGRG